MRRNKDYDRYLRSDKWRKKRKEVFAAQGRLCSSCGSLKSLHIHHKTYKNLYNEPLEDLIVVCEDCHSKIHSLFKKQESLQKKKRKPPKKKQAHWRDPLKRPTKASKLTKSKMGIAEQNDQLHQKQKEAKLRRQLLAEMNSSRIVVDD